MRRGQIILFIMFAFGAVCHGQNLTVFRSEWSVLQTTDRVQRNIHEQQLSLLETSSTFNMTDSEGAPVDSVVVVSFEDPRVTAEILACEPTAVLDLPQKIVIWRENGDVYMGFMDPYFMKKRFLILECEEPIERLSRHVLKVVNNTIKSH